MLSMTTNALDGTMLAMSSELWERLRAARRASGKSQQEIAERIGLSRAAIALWESKNAEIRTQPTMSNLRSFGHAVGAPMDWLMDDNADLSTFWQSNVQKSSKMEARVEELVTIGRPHPVLDPKKNTGYDHWDSLISEPDTVSHRISENFWRTVEYQVTEKNPSLASGFGQVIPIGGFTFKPDFLWRDVLIEFSTISRPHNFPSTSDLGKLLVFEKLYNGPLKKHLLGWFKLPFVPLGEAELKEKIEDERVVSDKLGVESKVITTPEEAIDYILRVACDG
jgi:transcriptional regulator with XRE-family HTH domain